MKVQLNRFKEVLLHGLVILVESLIALLQSAFLVCFAVAILCTVFLQFFYAIIFVVVAPFFVFLMALPSVILFCVPVVMMFDMLGYKKRVYWMFLGAFLSLPSLYLAFYFLRVEDVNMFILEEKNITMFFPIAIGVGVVTGSKLHRRIYREGLA